MIPLENVVVLALAAVPITVTDIRERRIPDVFSLGGLAAVLVLTLAGERSLLWDFAVPVVAGAGVFLAVRVAVRGNLGLGDVKYSTLMAAALGIEGWLIAVFAASAAGLAFALAARFKGKFDQATRIPFAPFLTFGAAAAILIEAIR